MSREEFLKGLEEVLEMENITEASPVSLTSLQTLSFVVFVQENFEKQLNEAELKELANSQTVADLVSLIGFTL